MEEMCGSAEIVPGPKRGTRVVELVGIQKSRNAIVLNDPAGMSRRSPGRFDYALMIVMIYFLAGNPVVTATAFRIMTAVLSVILVLVALATNFRLTQRHVFVVASFIGLFALQAIGTEYFAWIASIGFLVRILIALTATLLISDFPKVYIDVMFWTAVLSFPFYGLLVLTHGAIASWVAAFALRVPDPDVVLYYFPTVHLTQNNAYFWEPGVFGGYLILALVFLGARRERYTRRKYKIIFLVVVIAVVTTKSTGGYAALPLAMLYHGRALGRHLLTRLLVIIIAITIAVMAYQEAGFLGAKINRQFEVVEGQTGSWQVTRVGTLVSDWSQIKVHPLIGWGADASVRSPLLPSNVLTAEGNGLSSFTAEFGTIGLMVFLTATWIGFSSLFGKGGWLATLALTIVLMVLNDECFLSFPLFLSLMFIQGHVGESTLLESRQERISALLPPMAGRGISV